MRVRRTVIYYTILPRGKVAGKGHTAKSHWDDEEKSEMEYSQTICHGGWSRCPKFRGLSVSILKMGKETSL
jgi:hypothetical protein